MGVASLKTSVKGVVLDDNDRVNIQISFPNEIFHKVLLLLDLHSILNFYRSCRQFKVIASSYYLWKCLLIRDFSEKYVTIAQNDEFKDLYKVIFVIKQINPMFIRLQPTDDLIRRLYGTDREVIRFVISAGNF